MKNIKNKKESGVRARMLNACLIAVDKIVAFLFF